MKSKGESNSGKEEVEEEKVRVSFRVRGQKGGEERRAVGERMEGRSSPRKGPGEGRVEGVQTSGKKENPDRP